MSYKIRLDIKEECLGTEGVYSIMKYTHVPTNVSIQGPCQRFTQKDEYGLQNQLVAAVKGLYIYESDDSEAEEYCTECGRLKI